MTRRIHTVIHSWSQSLKSTWKIFALIAALALVQGPRILALSPEAQGAPAEVAAEPSLAEAGQTSKNVDLQFELLPPAASGEPNLLVQLGNPSPATGAETTFAGLEPGLHTARVILMDDHDQPLQGGIAMVHFRVRATTIPPTATPTSPQEIQGAAPAPPPPVPPELRGDADPGLPFRGSPLLLVSLVGFALLIGGILPGIRSRKITAVHP